MDLDDEFEEGGDNSDSEDDPDRLWCICKRPHNNRFMICCDVCTEWFHGKCVNVSKAMGKFIFMTTFYINCHKFLTYVFIF